LVGRQEGHPALKKLGVGLLVVMILLELCTTYSFITADYILVMIQILMRIQEILDRIILPLQDMAILQVLPITQELSVNSYEIFLRGGVSPWQKHISFWC